MPRSMPIIENVTDVEIKQEEDEELQEDDMHDDALADNALLDREVARYGAAIRVEDEGGDAVAVAMNEAMKKLEEANQLLITERRQQRAEQQQRRADQQRLSDLEVKMAKVVQENEEFKRTIQQLQDEKHMVDMMANSQVAEVAEKADLQWRLAQVFKEKESCEEENRRLKISNQSFQRTIQDLMEKLEAAEKVERKLRRRADVARTALLGNGDSVREQNRGSDYVFSPKTPQANLGYELPSPWVR